jgi:hypothetical protein
MAAGDQLTLIYINVGGTEASRDGGNDFAFSALESVTFHRTLVFIAQCEEGLE